MNPPFLNAPSRPSRERVPSGKISTDDPARMRSAARAMLRRAAAGSERSMKMKRPADIAQPRNGIRASCFLAMKRIGLGMAAMAAQMSTVEVWLATYT